MKAYFEGDTLVIECANDTEAMAMRSWRGEPGQIFNQGFMVIRNSLDDEEMTNVTITQQLRPRDEA